MSCHNIGRGMNWVAEEVVRLYDAGAYDRATAIDLIATAVDAVNWCDGNSGEATATLSGYRCGKCLKELDADEPVFSLWDLSDDEWQHIRTDRKLVHALKRSVGFVDLCADCFDSVLQQCTGDPQLGPRERALIIERQGEESCKASAYRDRNATAYYFERRRESDRRYYGD